MKNNNIILYAAILIFGVVAPFMLPAFKVWFRFFCHEIHPGELDSNEKTPILI